MTFHLLDRFVASRAGRWVAIAVWVALAGIIFLALPRLESVKETQRGQFLPAGAESARALKLTRQAFQTSTTEAIITVHDPNGLDAADRDVARQLASFLRSDQAPDAIRQVVAPFGVPAAVAAPLTSDDGTTMLLTVEIAGDPSSGQFRQVVETIRQHADQVESGASVQIAVGGPAGVLADLLSVFNNLNTFLLMVTVGLVFVLLIVLYRSPVFAVIPLIAVGSVYAVADGTAAWVSDTFGLIVNGQTIGVMTVVLFGAGTDYTLFVVARFKEELRQGTDKRDAIRRTMRGVRGAILSAGGTLLAAVLLLLFAQLRSYQSFGPVIAIAVALMMLAAITLIPAILVVAGKFAFWPSEPEPEKQGKGSISGLSGAYEHVASWVTARPAMTLAGAVVLLGLGLGGLPLYQPTFNQLKSLPSGAESVQAFDVISSAFPAGAAAPTNVVVRLPQGEGALTPEGLRDLDRIAGALTELPQVAMVRTASQPFGAESPVGVQDVLAATNAGSAPQDSPSPPPASGGAGGAAIPPSVIASAAEEFVAPQGDVARMSLTLSLPPYSGRALDQIPEIRMRAHQAAQAAGIAPGNVLVGGETAIAHDIRQANQRDMFVVLPMVLGAIAIILGILLRSVVAPIYLTVTILFTYFSTLGFSLLAFEYLFGHEALSSFVPFFLFVFTNALGIDYTIYLMSRIREEASESKLKEATRIGLARTGAVITSAGLILAGTFSALMTVSFLDLFQLGFAVALGVLIDTFVTRTLIVPSIVLLLGRWNWWPSKVGERKREGGRTGATSASQ